MKKWFFLCMVYFICFSCMSHNDEQAVVKRQPIATSTQTIFDPPKNTKVGFDVDGVLHTQVWYGRNRSRELGQYHPTVAHGSIFETTERNPAIKELATQWAALGNTFFIVSHNTAFCGASQNKQAQLLHENGIPMPLPKMFCSMQPKSSMLKKEKISVFVDDSPSVLQEIAYGAPSVRLFLAFPHHNVVAPYFYQTPLEIEQCGMVFISKALGTRQNRVLLQHRNDPEGWQIPHGDCNAKINRTRTCTSAVPCEDPAAAALRLLNEQAGQHRLIQLPSNPRMEVLHVDSLFLLIVKVDADQMQDLHPQPIGLPWVDLNTPVTNVANSPGYQWFTQE